MRRTMLTLAFALIATAQPAFAHGAQKPSHGGIVQMTGETLFELVRAPAGVSVYVIDDDEAVTATGMAGQISITTAGKTRTVMLKSAAGNRFDAPGLKLPAGTKAAVQIVDKTSQTRLGTTFLIP